MTVREMLQIACALAAGVVLASFPFLQYRWERGHHHGGADTVQRGH